MKRLAIIGAGDLGQLIAHHATGSFDVVGFFDDFAEGNISINGKPILGTLSEIQSQFEANIFDELIVAIGYKHMSFRAKVYDTYSNSIPMASVIHASCFIDKSSKIGKGVCLLPGSILDRNSVIHDNVLVNVGCTIAHDSVVKRHSFLSPSVAIAGFVEIGARCVIGINSTVIDNITIADDIRTGGGAVVIDSLQESGLYVGNPSRFVK